MRQLTERQEQVLHCIKDHLRRHGVPPTRMEVAEGIGLRDASTVSAHLEKLAEGGWIRLLPNTRRGIRVLDEQVPLVGRLFEVAAGTPIVAESNIVEHIPAAVAERFRPRPDYFLTVRGDSMDRTGLRDGDVVAIRATPEAENGDVVVARFGDEVTLKRFIRHDRRHVELRPESHNPEHEPMDIDLAKHLLHIDGVAVGALIGQLGSAAKRTTAATEKMPSEDKMTKTTRFDEQKWLTERWLQEGPGWAPDKEDAKVTGDGKTASQETDQDNETNDGICRPTLEKLYAAQRKQKADLERQIEEARRGNPK